MNQKLNNGYVFMLWYANMTIEPRCFGPFETPAKALHHAITDLGLKALVEKPDRPTLWRRYVVNSPKNVPDNERIAYISFATLENSGQFGTNPVVMRGKVQ